MDTNKKEEELRKEREEVRDANRDLRYNAKKRQEETTRKNNRLWLWLGVIILIFILVYWLWTIGIFEDLTGVTNG